MIKIKYIITIFKISHNFDIDFLINSYFFVFYVGQAIYTGV